MPDLSADLKQLSEFCKIPPPSIISKGQPSRNDSNGSGMRCEGVVVLQDLRYISRFCFLSRTTIHVYCLRTRAITAIPQWTALPWPMYGYTSIEKARLIKWICVYLRIYLGFALRIDQHLPLLVMNIQHSEETILLKRKTNLSKCSPSYNGMVCEDVKGMLDLSWLPTHPIS